MADDYLTFPGRELPKVWRDIAVRLVQEQGWSYRYKRRGGSHPRVIPPDSGGLGVALPTTVTDGDAGHRASYLTALRRHGAVLDPLVAPPERRSVVPGPDDAGMTETMTPVEVPWTESEWRELQRRSDVWWRQQFAGPEPEPEPEPEPAPKRELSTYAQGVLARAKGTVPDDAAGNGSFTLADARQQLRDGYSMERVIARTGWGRLWLQDLADRLGA